MPKAYGVRLSKEGLKQARWRMDIRAWLAIDWADAAEVDPRVVYRWLSGEPIHPTTAGKLQRAFLEHSPIEGLSELLESEVVAS